MLKKITCLLVSIILIFTLSVSVFAESLKSQKSDLEDKIDEATDKKEDVKSALSNALQEVEELNVSIDENQDKLEDLTEALSNLSNDIESLKKELEETQQKYTAQEELLKDRITAQYIAGEIKYLDVLLNSTGFSDFLSNYFLVSEILENDSDLLTSIENQKLKIEKDKQSLEEKEKDLKTKKAEQEKIKVILNNQKVQKQNKISQLSDEEKKLSSEIEQYKQEVKKIEAQIKANEDNAINSEPGKVYTGGEFLWPCPNYTRISSPFGYRICPYHGKELHSGIDMAAPYGSSILAAADGKVVTSGWGGSYGNMIMIYHGSNLFTIYAHCSSLLVSAGTNVSKGDLIAKVGSTGDSTGNHLHFGVKLNGKYVSPNGYLGM